MISSCSQAQLSCRDRLIQQPGPALRDALPSGLRAIDWIALVVVGLTVASAVVVNVLANLAHSDVRRVDVIPQSVEFLPDGLLALFGVGGLIVGTSALLISKGSRKWPGVLALLCPVIAIIGDLVALSIQLRGIT